MTTQITLSGDKLIETTTREIPIDELLARKAELELEIAELENILLDVNNKIKLIQK